MTSTLSRPATEEVALPTNLSSRGVSSSRRAMGRTEPQVASPAGLDSPAAKCGSPSIEIAPQEAAPPATVPNAVPTGMSSRGTKTSRRANLHPVPDVLSPAGTDSTSPATVPVPAPKASASRGTKTAGRRAPTDARGTDAADTNSRSADPGTSPEESTLSGRPDRAAGDEATPMGVSLLDPALSLAADVLDDLERVRIANENRLRQMTRSVEDADGEERGFGLDETHPDVARLAAMVVTLKAVEHDATLNLQRHMRRHPLGAWMKGQRGIGEKQGARLLATIGDPYWRPELTYLNDEGSIVRKVPAGPRTVSALWAYCGLHVLPGGLGVGDDQVGRAAGDQHRDTDRGSADAQLEIVGVAAKRRKGQRSNWSTKAKTKAYLIAEKCMTQVDTACRDAGYPHAGRGSAIRSSATRAETPPPACACSPYRLVYDERRRHTAISRPEWTDGHSHNDALRVASKAILRDLWRAAREWHLTNA